MANPIRIFGYTLPFNKDSGSYIYKSDTYTLEVREFVITQTLWETPHKLWRARFSWYYETEKCKSKNGIYQDRLFKATRDLENLYVQYWESIDENFEAK